MHISGFHFQSSFLWKACVALALVALGDILFFQWDWVAAIWVSMDWRCWVAWLRPSTRCAATGERGLLRLRPGYSPLP